MSEKEMNTFFKYAESNEDALKKIIDFGYDYIVPVERKGCKLLRYFSLKYPELASLVRYRPYFENTKPDLKGKRVIIIDDAAKYTSTLYDYRVYFENLGADVDTYAFIGNDKLEKGIRKQYDEKAVILRYLPESTYQEYIAQQSITLSKADNFYDIDHILFRIQMNRKDLKKMFDRIMELGRIDFTNDVYTPLNITKFCLYNLNFPVHTPFDADTGVDASALQKIRFSYNSVTQILSIVPLNLVSWDTMNREAIFDCIKQVPLTTLYEMDSHIIEDEGIYMNILFISCIYMIKDLLQQLGTIINPQSLSIETYDLGAYIGDQNRLSDLVKSINWFLSNESDTKDSVLPVRIRNSENCPEAFDSVCDVMRHLREKYEDNVNSLSHVLHVQYFLSFDAIVSHYQGKASLMKWIDILCDRGVLVTRNRLINGIFMRVCRSGEGDPDHIDEKTEMLLPVIISLCGTNKTEDNDEEGIETEQAKKKEIATTPSNSFFRVQATYLNKILANLAYDYPNNQYDFHGFYTEPYMYGPLAHAKKALDNEKEYPLYQFNKISPYCEYDQSSKMFIGANPLAIKETIAERFSPTDMTPLTEITNYVKGLIAIKKDANKADILNELVLCRNPQYYYKHVYFDIDLAFKNIRTAMTVQSDVMSELALRDAAKVANEAVKKLKYDQDKIFQRVDRCLQTDMAFFDAHQKIMNSRVPFPNDLKTNIIPKVHQIAILEQIMVNLMLWEKTLDIKYYSKFDALIRTVNNPVVNQIVELVDKDSQEPDKGKEPTPDFELPYDQMRTDLFEEIVRLIQDIPQYNITSRQEMLTTVNKCVQHIRNNNLKEFYILDFDYSGYRNLEGQAVKNIPLIMQKYASSAISLYESADYVFGDVGENNRGTCIFAHFNDAISFASGLLNYQRTQGLNQVHIRFGCSKGEPSYKKPLDTIVQNAWKKAECIPASPNVNSVFSILQDTYNSLKKEDQNKFIALANVYLGPEKEQCYMSMELGKTDPMTTFDYDPKIAEDVSIGIITVLTEEFIAMKKMLDSPVNIIVPRDPKHKFSRAIEYCMGTLKTRNNQETKIVLARTQGQGNDSAAIRVTQLLNSFPNISIIFMTGIAGGIPSVKADPKKDIRIGDIITSKGIVNYDFIKDKGEVKELNGPNIDPNPVAIEASKRLDELELEGKKPWEDYIRAYIQENPKFAQPQKRKVPFVTGTQKEESVPSKEQCSPRVFHEKIASANRLVRNEALRDILREKYNAYAVEMEGSGIKDATYEAERGYYVVRGICDYCDTRKDDTWHLYAALVAAAYTRALIENILL